MESFSKMKLMRMIQSYHKNSLKMIRKWEKHLKLFYAKNKNIVFRKKHIYTIIGERTYDFIGEKDGAANGGTEFFLLNKLSNTERLIGISATILIL